MCFVTESVAVTGFQYRFWQVTVFFCFPALRPQNIFCIFEHYETDHLLPIRCCCWAFPISTEDWKPEKKDSSWKGAWHFFSIFCGGACWSWRVCTFLGLLLLYPLVIGHLWLYIKWLNKLVIWLSCLCRAFLSAVERPAYQTVRQYVKMLSMAES